MTLLAYRESLACARGSYVHAGVTSARVGRCRRHTDSQAGIARVYPPARPLCDTTEQLRYSPAACLGRCGT